jgi:hypothetical protein
LKKEEKGGVKGDGEEGRRKKVKMKSEKKRS